VNRFELHSWELHVFELAYVLSLMQVESVATLPDAVLFPKDPKLRKKVLAEGERRLIAGGRITPSATGGRASYDDDLLSMAAAVADPRFSLLTRRQTSQGGRADATIFFNQVEVVEVTQTDRQAFRLRRLATAADAFSRVRKMLGVPPSPARHSAACAEMGIQAFDRIRRHATAGEISEAVLELVEAGLTSDAATDLASSLNSPERKGIVSVLKHIAQKVTDVRVLGFYFRAGSGWLTSVVSESTDRDRTDRVRIEAIDTDGFLRRLTDRVGNLCRE
jgi:hypothetical protein